MGIARHAVICEAARRSRSCGRCADDGGDLLGDRGQRREAVGRILGQHLQAERFGPQIKIGTQLAGWRRILRDDLRHHRAQRAAKRQLAGEHLVEDHAQAELVGRGTDFVGSPVDLFGRHVGGRADEHAALRDSHVLVALELPRQAEVHDDWLVPLVDHDVGRLEIAVHDAVLVGFGQRVGQLANDD